MDNINKIKKLHEQAEAALVANKFNRPTYIAKQKEIDSILSEMKAKESEHLSDIAEKLSLDGRKALANAMKKHMHHHYHNEHSHGEWHNGDNNDNSSSNNSKAKNN